MDEGADQPPPQPPQAQHAQAGGGSSLRALYQRVKSSPLEVVAIDTAGVAPVASPSEQGPGSGSGGGSSPSTPTRYEQVPLRTRPSILDRELSAVLSAPPTLEGVHSALERAVLNLRATEAFDDVWAEIDGDPPDVPDACTVRLRLRERRWWSARGGAFVGAGGEASVEGAAEARNLLGAADQWRVSAEWGQRNSSEFALSWRQPRALPPARTWFGASEGAGEGGAGGSGASSSSSSAADASSSADAPPFSSSSSGRRLTPEVRLFQTVRNMQHWSSFTESLRGVYVGVSTAAGCPPFGNGSDPTIPTPSQAERAEGEATEAGGPLRAARALRRSALLLPLLPPPDAVHSVGYTLGWMNLSDASAAAGRGVQSQLGDALRGALSWQALVDRRGAGAGGGAGGDQQGYCPGFGGVAAAASAAEDGWALRWSAELGGLAPGAPPSGRYAKAGWDWALSRELADLDEQQQGAEEEGGAVGVLAAAAAAGGGGDEGGNGSNNAGSLASSSSPPSSPPGDDADRPVPYRLGKLSLSLAASGGLLLPWQPPAVAAPSAAPTKPPAATTAAAATTTTRPWWDRPSCIADRFFLGGPDSLRGFEWRGVGPSDERRPRPGAAGAAAAAAASAAAAGGPPPRDALGGDLYASVFAALEWLPGAPLAEALNVRLHAFVNGGTAALLAGASSSSSSGGPAPASLPAAVARRAADAAAAFRWSAGVGLVVPTPAGRFEANWAWVLSSRPGDRARPGLQLGFATSPLLR